MIRGTMSDETYAYIDFAVIVAPQIDVLCAVAALRSDYAAAGDVDCGAETTRSGGIIGRVGERARAMISGGRYGDEAPAMDIQNMPLFLHCDEDAELDRLITWSMEEDSSGIPPETRVSALAEHPGWTMVEFADPMSGVSYTAMNLSTDLAGAPVYYFRRSGSGTDQPHFDFHHYLDGEQRRRVSSQLRISKPRGRPRWEGCSQGAYLPFEDPILYDRADAAMMMTANKQLALLGQMGLSMASLFGAGARDKPVLISDKPGGAPVSILLGS